MLLSAFLYPLLACEFHESRKYNYAFLISKKLANSLEKKQVPNQYFSIKLKPTKDIFAFLIKIKLAILQTYFQNVLFFMSVTVAAYVLEKNFFPQRKK